MGPRAQGWLHFVAGALLAAALCNVLTATLLWRQTGWTSDPDRGRIYRPGLHVNGLEGFAWSRINALGMPGPEVGRKGARESRVLFLGDSLTEAFQVPDRERFSTLLGERLRASGLEAATVNAGVSGGSPASYLYLAPWYLQRLEPELVVVQVSDQDFESDIDVTGRNFYVRNVHAGYEVVFNRAFLGTSRVLQRFPWAKRALRIPVVGLAAENVSKVTRVGRQEEDSAAVDVRLVAWVVDELAKRYPRLVILYLPELDYIREPLAEKPTETALRAACSGAGVTFVSMRGPFTRMFVDDNVAPNGFANSTPGAGHLNRAGHAAVADALLPAVESLLEEGSAR